VVDYGVVEVKSTQLGEERGLDVAFEELRDLAAKGWDGWTPDAVWVDSGYQTDLCYRKTREFDRKIWKPVKGHGQSSRARIRYARPRGTTQVVKWLGEEYHFSILKDRGVVLVEINVDHWKSWVHNRIRQPCFDSHGRATAENGALTLFAPERSNEHFALGKHVTAERAIDRFVPGKGMEQVWERQRKANHWLDTLVYASAAAHRDGVRLVAAKRAQKVSTGPRKRALVPLGELVNPLL
jgi:phage terminase large subunit GpA-like protein